MFLLIRAIQFLWILNVTCVLVLLNDFSDISFLLISFSYSLVILGNCTEFERAVLWLSENLTFDVDARVNLFEVLIC